MIEPGHRARISNVQALRAIAVLLVMFLHLRDLAAVRGLGAWLPDWASVGHAGVDLFFVISGFVMVLIGHADEARPRAAGRFLYRRWARIYPTYWFWFLVTLLVYLTAPAWLRLRPGDLTHLLESFLLVPTWTPQLVAVSWTLKYELYFYLVFSLIILLPAGWRMPALALWGGAMLIGQSVCYRAPEILCHKSLFLTMHPLAFEFLFGALVAWLYLRVRVPRPFAVLWLGIGLLVAGALVYVWSGVHLDDNIWYRVLLFGMPAAVLLQGCLEVERQAGWTAPGWLSAIGDASYSIYLSHFLIFELLFGALVAIDAMPSPLLDMMVFGAALGVGLLAHRWVERPLLDLTRGRWRRRGRVLG